MTATRPSELTASQGVRAMRAGDLTPTALLEDCIARVDELEASVSAWARFEPEAARRDAARLDEELAAGTHTAR